MMELKLVCYCGQKYKFDVEPVNGQMPFVVNCPICGLEGTNSANAILGQMPAFAQAAPALAAAPTFRPSAPAYAAAPAPRPAPSARAPSATAPAPALPKYLQTNQAIQNNSFILGTLGALIGAVFAVGFMVGTKVFFGFSFPLFGTIMGVMIGFGARLMYRGTDSTLGGMSALVAFVTIGATLYIMFGILGILFCLVSLVIGTAAAFKIASG